MAQLNSCDPCCAQVSDSALPVARAEHGALVDQTAQVAYIVGGHDDRGTILDR